MNDLQVAAILGAELLLLQQELRQPGDRRERVVELVRDARHEVAHRRELFALDQLGLERLLLGDVLDQHDQRAAGGGVGHAGGGHAHHAVEGRGAGHERRRPFPAAGGVEQLEQGLGLPQQRIAQMLPHHRLDRPAQQRGERPVGAPHAPFLVHQRHALGEGVERRLPLVLRLAHEIEEAGVGEHDGGVRCERGEQADVFRREAAGARIGDQQRAHRDAVGVQRHRRGGVGLDVPQQARRPATGVAHQLELVAAQRACQQASIVPVDGVVLECGERAQRGGDAQRRRAPARGTRRQGDQGPPGLEEAQREAHHLIGDALQLQRIGEDVGELLEGKQLREAAVQLVGSAAAVALAAQQPCSHVPGESQHRDERDAEGCDEGITDGIARGPARARAHAPARAWRPGSRNRSRAPHSSPSGPRGS